MPTYHKKRMYRRKRRAPSRWKVYGAAGTQLVRDVAKLKGLINVEFKLHNLNLNLVPLVGTPTINYLNLVPQGDTVLTRDGAQFRNKSIAIRWVATLAEDSGDHAHVRILLGIHKNVNGTALTVDDVTADDGPNSHRNYDNQKNVIILKEWMFTMTALNDSSQQAESYYLDLDLITRYQTANTDGAVTGMEQGGVFLIAQSNVAGILDAPAIGVESRLRYVDN